MPSLLSLALAVALPLVPCRADAATFDAVALVQRSVGGIRGEEEAGRPKPKFQPRFENQTLSEEELKHYSFRMGDEVLIEGSSPKRPVVVIGYGPEPERYNLEVQGQGIFSNVDGQILRKPRPPAAALPARRPASALPAMPQEVSLERATSADKSRMPFPANASRYPYPPAYPPAYPPVYPPYYLPYYPPYYSPYYGPYNPAQQQVPKAAPKQQAPKPAMDPIAAAKEVVELRRRMRAHTEEEKRIEASEQAKRRQQKLMIGQHDLEKKKTTMKQLALEQTLEEREQFLARQQTVAEMVAEKELFALKKQNTERAKILEEQERLKMEIEEQQQHLQSLHQEASLKSSSKAVPKKK